MAGYLTERARLAGALRGEKKSAKDVPLLWDMASKESYEGVGGHSWSVEKIGSTTVDYSNMVSSAPKNRPILRFDPNQRPPQTPLALVPLLPAPPLEPIPISTLKFFPNSMAFRAPKPPVSAEAVMKRWEAELAIQVLKPGNPAETQGRNRARTVSLIVNFNITSVASLIAAISFSAANPSSSSILKNTFRQPATPSNARDHVKHPVRPSSQIQWVTSFSVTLACRYEIRREAWMSKLRLGRWRDREQTQEWK